MFKALLQHILKFCNEDQSFGLNTKTKQAQSLAREFWSKYSLSDLLPYESYDPDSKLYFNHNSIGFILNAPLFIGSENSFENSLENIFKTMLPENSNIQFLLLAWPKIEQSLEQWQYSRNQAREAKGREIIIELTKRRCDYFRELKQAKNSDLRVRSFQGLISVSIPGKEFSGVELAGVSELITRIKGIFQSRGTAATDLAPAELINLLLPLLNYRYDRLEYNRQWQQLDNLSQQMIDPSSCYDINSNNIRVNDDQAEYRFYSVRQYPSTWSLSQMSKLIGTLDNDFLHINCAFFFQFGIHVVGGNFKKNAMLTKASRVETQAATKLGKYVPSLRREAAEWDYVRQQLERNQRLVQTNFQVMLIDELDRINRSEQDLINLFLANGWELQTDHFIVLQSLLSMLPMSWGDGVLDYHQFFRRLRTTLSHEPVNLLPLQAESAGCKQAGMLLTGRRGQLAFWYPFDQTMGNTNYNVSVVGRSGSGKSVFMQDLATSILGLGGKVYVLDVGRSFAKQAQLFEGQFLEFAANSQLCLNPFSNINTQSRETIEDGLNLLQPIIALMAAPKDGTSDYEDRLIAIAIQEVWQQKGPEAEINDIVEWFLNHENDQELCQRLGVMLYPFSRKGAYSKYFNGPANINFASSLVVVELEELKSKPDLQQVIVQILMTVITNNVILGDRRHYSGIIFDEAWELLGGKQTGKFIERCARTLRKYEGSLIVGTQTLDDFYSSDGAQAAFANSDWVCMFAQKAESIARFAQDARMKLNDRDCQMLESVKTIAGKYAELAIITNNQAQIFRLLLDPFSLLLYSTKPEEYRRIQELQSYGLTITQALEQAVTEQHQPQKTTEVGDAV
ncbi:MAG: type IV secretion system protein TraC [Pseudomonadota bacterium]